MEDTYENSFFERYKMDWIISIILSVIICVVYFIVRTPGDVNSLITAYGTLLSICGFGYISGHDGFKYPPAAVGILIFLIISIIP